MSEQAPNAQHAPPTILDFSQTEGELPHAPNQAGQKTAITASFIAKIGVSVGQSIGLGQLDSFHIAGPNVSCAVEVTTDEFEQLRVTGALSSTNTEPTALLHHVHQAMR